MATETPYYLVRTKNPEHGIQCFEELSAKFFHKNRLFLEPQMTRPGLYTFRAKKSFFRTTIRLANFTAFSD